VQEDACGTFELPYPVEDPLFGSLPDALDRAKSSLLARLLELGHGLDARGAENLDASQKSNPCAERAARQVLLALSRGGRSFDVAVSTTG
jgi:hypothetical protein